VIEETTQFAIQAIRKQFRGISDAIFMFKHMEHGTWRGLFHHGGISGGFAVGTGTLNRQDMGGFDIQNSEHGQQEHLPKSPQDEVFNPA
jgi:hypothetical protein